MDAKQSQVQMEEHKSQSTCQCRKLFVLNVVMTSFMSLLCVSTVLFILIVQSDGSLNNHPCQKPYDISKHERSFDQGLSHKTVPSKYSTDEHGQKPLEEPADVTKLLSSKRYKKDATQPDQIHRRNPRSAQRSETNHHNTTICHYYATVANPDEPWTYPIDLVGYRPTWRAKSFSSEICEMDSEYIFHVRHAGLYQVYGQMTFTETDQEAVGFLGRRMTRTGTAWRSIIRCNASSRVSTCFTQTIVKLHHGDRISIVATVDGKLDTSSHATFWGLIRLNV